MRESIGAAWIFSLVLIFILMFTGFVAVSINYARAFQLKNAVANMIEENEGVSDSLESVVMDYVVQNGYTAHCTVAIYKADISNYNYLNDTKNKNVFKNNDGAPSDGDPSVKRDYYKVITFFNFDLPFFRRLLTFRVNGETQIIYDFAACNGSGCGIQ